MQKIQILRESDILFPGKKIPVQIILIADCIVFPGTNWENYVEPIGYAIGLCDVYCFSLILQ
jgi:hypothetical protein